MGYNNTMYRLFQEMLDGYTTDNDGLFEHGARCMMDQNPTNPFSENTAEAELFFQMQNTYHRWKNRGADMKVNRRRMLAAATELCQLVNTNPYIYSKQEEKEDLEEQKKQEELKKQEEKRRLEIIKEAEERKEEQEIEREKTKNISDPKVAMVAMVKAHNMQDEETFKQSVIQLMSVATENPFAPRTEEYNKFLEMMTCFNRKPTNMRRVYVVAEQLCELINNTEPAKKEYVLGVLPDEEKEKKNWLKFLFPWRKERDKDDSE